MANHTGNVRTDGQTPRQRRDETPRGTVLTFWRAFWVPITPPSGSIVGRYRYLDGPLFRLHVPVLDGSCCW
jgi:hypothetical protein